MLLAVTRIIIEIRNSRRYLKKRFILGSECIYQRANSRMDQVTYRATGVKMIEYKSNLKLMLMSNGPMFIQFQLVVIDSKPWSRKINKGIKLIKKEIFTAVFTCEDDQFGLSSLGEREEINGKARIIKIKRKDELKIIFIALAWSCTKSFWFLRPIDYYYLSRAE